MKVGADGEHHCLLFPKDGVGFCGRLRWFEKAELQGYVFGLRVGFFERFQS